MTDRPLSPAWRPLLDWRRAGGGVAELAERLSAAGIDDQRRTAALSVPGRIELFGKHTDYAGGRSLVAAIDRGLLLLVAPRADSTVHWCDLGRGVEAQFDVANPGARPGHWSNYLLTPARRAAADLDPFSGGVEVAMTSDLPAAAGLSSSSALVVAAYLVFAAAEGEQRPARIADRARLAAYLGAVENGAPFEGSGGSEGVGTFGGSEDHAAILCGDADRATQFAFCPLTCERQLAWPAGWRLAIGASGVRAKKTGGAKKAFNRLSTLAAEAAAVVQRATGGDIPHLGAALVAVGGGAELETILAAKATGTAAGEHQEALRRRALHFALESGKLVPAAAEALAAADAAAFGRAAAKSQQGAEELLGNQIDETSVLARLALANGAQAASASGGGFGGSVWALAPAADIEPFLERWRAAYTAAFPQHLEASLFFATAPAAGARWLSVNERDAATEQTP